MSTIESLEKEILVLKAALKSNEDKDKQLADYRTLRKTARASIKRIAKFVDEKAPTAEIFELECRLGILESYFKQFLNIQLEIERIVGDHDDHERVRSEVEESYINIKSNLQKFIAPLKTNSVDLNNTITHVTQSTNPRVKLPLFDGKYSEYQNFMGLFTELIDKNVSYSDLEKFNELRNHLRGLALSAMSKLEVTAANYKEALKLLKDRFDNKNLTFQEHIKGLFNLNRVEKFNSLQLRELIDNANSHFSAIKSTGSYENIVNAFIIYLVNQKLDADSRQKWEETIDYSELSNWSDCLATLNKRCQNLEARQTLASRETEASKFQANKAKNSTALQITEIHCACCNKKSHSIEKCFKFKGLSFYERVKLVKRLALCLQCLGKGHMAKDCKSSPCPICGNGHHEVLHRETDYAKHEEKNLESKSDNHHLVNLHLSLPNCNESASNYCFLATAVVKIKDSNGNFHTARMLLDSASQLNFVRESLVQKLKLRKQKDVTEVTGIGDINSTIRCRTSILLKSRFNDYEASFSALVIPTITAEQPGQKIDVTKWKIPANIELADPQFNIPSKIDILLGADHFFELLSVGQIKLGQSLPVLQKTLLGWIVAGKITSRSANQNYCCIVSQNSLLDDMVGNFWKIEEKNYSLDEYSEEQKKMEEIFENNVQHIENKAVMVKLPFKTDPNCLGETRKIAEKRFMNLEKKLNKNVELKKQYVEFMKEYESLDHMEVVPDHEVDNVKYYAPHHPVIRPDSTSTKLRVVFDCSCKSSSNVSLNELLMKGPTVQNDLFSILLKFRQYKYALSSDIVKMYRQVLVYPADRMYQCILWREKSNEKLQAFRLKTVTYGTTAAPYLATKTLNWLAEKYKTKFPVGAKIIKSSFYVDDYIGGCNSVEEISIIVNEVTNLLNKGNMELKKWYSNEIKYLSEIPETHKQKLLRINESDVIKTLGLTWEPGEDSFQFVAPESQSALKLTKRGVLSQMSQLFDPLGIVNPIIVKAKIFMQDLWKLNLKWDESLPFNLHNMWLNYLNELKEINLIKITRYIATSSNFRKMEIHGFSDASDRAYGGCIYVRSFDENNKIFVQLLCAKSRVSPVQSRTLPRLELCAAELLVELLKKVLENFIHKIDNIILWSDSKIVLNWLAAHPSTWSVFVSHRVATIQELSKNCVWRYVNSKSNPADIVSRGCSVHQLLTSIWFSGPDYLQQDETWWPENCIIDSTSCSEEKRKNIISMVVSSVSSQFQNHYCNSNDFEKIVRKFAYVVRICEMLKTKNFDIRLLATGPSVLEMERGLLRIVWHIQQLSFTQEIKNLKNNKAIHPKSKIKSLSPFFDESADVGVLRVGGRLHNANMSFSTKHPILLPYNHVFCYAYLNYLHFRNYHAGPQALIATCRQKFWIINCRRMARNVVNKCVHCARYRPKLCKQLMGNLPSLRINEARPFLTTGVDFCGPFMTSLRIRGRPPYKTYIAVFVCFATKAVHLEVVSDLSSWGFIAALKRFVSRRGKCQHIYCDNGTNLVGARNQLKEFREKFLEQQTQQRIASWCLSDGIQFHFIPPRAPHFGGLWEAAVKSAKKHLYSTTYNANLTYEELCTVVTEIECILNSRPLVQLSSSADDEEVLTPGHFLIGSPMNAIIEPKLENKSLTHRNRWRFLCEIKEHFWKRWVREYLSELQTKSKWCNPVKEVEIGQLMLIAEDNSPPQQWLMGRIVKTFPGKDGYIRVVQLKTKNGELRRPVHKLAPLPLN